jgi:hypothetical protein
MIKYRVTLSDQIREFKIEEDAQAFAGLNNTTYEQIEYLPVDDIELPNLTPRQFRQALVLSNISVEDIEANINLLSEPHRSLAKIEWEYSTAFIRSNPLIDQIGSMMGLSTAQINDVWSLGLTL